jgi:hypothetical protein
MEQYRDDDERGKGVGKGLGSGDVMRSDEQHRGRLAWAASGRVGSTDKYAD